MSAPVYSALIRLDKQLLLIPPSSPMLLRFFFWLLTCSTLPHTAQCIRIEYPIRIPAATADDGWRGRAKKHGDREILSLILQFDRRPFRGSRCPSIRTRVTRCSCGYSGCSGCCSRPSPGERPASGRLPPDWPPTCSR